jgi:ketosteroid isomerase-like protein
MSQENVEAVRAAYDAWNRQDLPAVLDYLHADIEWEENAHVYPGLDPVYHGHDGFLKRQRDAFDAWEWIKIEEQEFLDAGQHVVALMRLVAKGRHSGIETEMSVADVFTFRGSKVARHRLYTDRDDALEAVGLAG